MLSQFVFALKMSFSLLVHVRCFVSVVLCSVLLFHFVIFVSLSFSFNEESGLLQAGGGAQEEHRRGETVAGRVWSDTGGVQSGERMLRREMLFQNIENEI